MARMSIDDKFLRDGRVKLLGQRFGWSRRETMGALLDVFAVAYDREDDVLPAVEVDIAADQAGFAIAMVAVDLGEMDGPDMRVKGAAERIEYLAKKREAGAKGGRKSGETRRNRREAKRSSASEAREAFGNPPDPVPDLPLVPDPAPDPVPDLFPEARSASPPRRRKEPTGDHGRVIAAFDQRFRERFSQPPTWGSKQAGQVKQLLAKHPADEVIRRIAILFDSPPAFLLNSPPDVATLVQHFDKLVQPATMANGTRAGPQRNPALQRLHDEIATREANGET